MGMSAELEFESGFSGLPENLWCVGEQNRERTGRNVRSGARDVRRPEIMRIINSRDKDALSAAMHSLTFIQQQTNTDGFQSRGQSEGIVIAAVSYHFLAFSVW